MGDTVSDIDIHIYDLRRQTLDRLTFDPMADEFPMWTVDGQRIVFYSQREGGGLLSKAADGTGQAERLTQSATGQIPGSFSPDGKFLVIDASTAGGRRDVQVLSLEDAQTRPLISTRFPERVPRLSPNGRWLMFQSSETGTFEIFVKPFPNVNEGGWQVTRSGGRHPLWARDGRALFYMAEERLVTVPVETESSFVFGNAEVITDGAARDSGQAPNYDVDLDGERFVMVKDIEGTSDASQIHVVLNWHQELLERVPIP